jgi:hypothetical protein
MGNFKEHRLLRVCVSMHQWTAQSIVSMRRPRWTDKGKTSSAGLGTGG